MSDLHTALTEHAAMRRSVGFRLRLPASLLRSFVAFVEHAGSPFITTALALQWATMPPASSPPPGRDDSPSRGASQCGGAEQILKQSAPPAALLPHRYRRIPLGSTPIRTSSGSS